jgi:ribosomal protein S13
MDATQGGNAMNRKLVLVAFAMVGTFSAAVLAQGTVRVDLAKIRADLQEIKSGGYITQDDLSALMQQVRAAREGGITPEEREAIAAAVTSLASQVPAELIEKLKGDLGQLKIDVQKLVSDRVPDDVEAAAAKVRQDLRAIAEGGYITQGDVKQIASAFRSALADRQLTEEEVAAVQALINEKASAIPADLQDQLKGDVQTLKDTIQKYGQERHPRTRRDLGRDGGRGDRGHDLGRDNSSRDRGPDRGKNDRRR